jgi:hypothetical protein
MLLVCRVQLPEAPVERSRLCTDLAVFHCFAGLPIFGAENVGTAVLAYSASYPLCVPVYKQRQFALIFF